MTSSQMKSDAFSGFIQFLRHLKSISEAVERREVSDDVMNQNKSELMLNMSILWGEQWSEVMGIITLKVRMTHMHTHKREVVISFK